MRHILPSEIVADLERRYQADLARTRALYSTPWRQYAQADEFEDNPSADQRFSPALIGAVLIWLALSFAIGGIVRAVGSVWAPASTASIPKAHRSDFGPLR